MKNVFKKISMSIITGTIILGSITSVGASSYNYKTKTNYKNFYNYKYYKHNNHKYNNPKPSTPTNNNTTQDQNNQDKNNNNNTTQDQNNQDKNHDIQNTPANTSNIESEVLRLVNIERTKEGLSPLKISNELSSVANKKSQDMADNNYFSHTSPTYGSPFDMMKQFGINYTSAGENIAQGYSSAESVMNGWMNSPGHRANILSSNFGTLGVGYVNKGGTTYWTQMFTN